MSSAFSSVPRRLLTVALAGALLVTPAVSSVSPGTASAAVVSSVSTTSTGAKITLTAPAVKVNGDTATFSYSVTASKRTTFRYLQVAVRTGTGEAVGKDTGHALNTSFRGTRTFTATQTLSPGDWRAFVAYSTDGSRWVNGPVTTFTVTPAPAATPAPTADAPATSVSQLGYFYRPPVGTSLDAVASGFDRYVLTRLDEPTRDQLRQRGETKPFLQYLRFEAIMDNTGLGYTWHNQVAFKQGDWEDISRNHPDWFLLDSSGRRITAGSGDSSETSFYLMDPMNPGWRSFFVTRLHEMQVAGQWDGAFLDNVELSLAKRERSGQIPAKYPTDASYQTAVKDFLTYLRTSYFSPTGKLVEANLIEQRTGNDPLWHANLEQLDGAMREGWAVGWDNTRLRDAASWERELQMAEATQAAGKHVWLVAIGSKDNHARQQFAYASYLLVANGNASFRYAHHSMYNQPWIYDNYGRDLGRPLGPRYASGGLWKRDFANGTVTVNPTTGVATIS